MEFLEHRRTRLGLSRTQIAARISTTAEAVRRWEIELVVPSIPISSLASAYEVSEDKMADEVMALRRRIEARVRRGRVQV